MKVYLSSTLTDLADERRAAKDALIAAGCSVQESYLADERSLRNSIHDDIAQCDAYILILGLRYGFIPALPGNDKSITHVEYEHAKAKGLTRLVFLKKASQIAADKTDAYSSEHPKELIERFRARFATGSDEEPRGAEFTTADDLKYAVAQGIAMLRQQRAGSAPILSGQTEHPRRVSYDMCICALPGTDDDLNLPAVADNRTAVVSISPQPEHDYVARLDQHARSCRSLLMVLRLQSLSRLKSREAVVIAAIKVLQTRLPVYALLVDLTPSAVPVDLAAAFDDMFESAASEWLPTNRKETVARLVRWRRERVPDTLEGSRVGVPYFVAALTSEEAARLQERPDEVFGQFGTAATVRRAMFDELRNGLSASGLIWPGGFYGERRSDWRPFGAGTPTVEQFVSDAARKVNRAPPGSRERRVLLQAQLMPQRYRLEEYLDDAYGSAENLRAVCEEGCLVLVDEFATLHPDLRTHLDHLLSSNNAAVVSISACDPAHRSLHKLLDEFSYLRVGNLFLRFKESEDMRCELAVNSIARLQRWLRFVLPELMVTLGQQQSNPSLLDRVETLLPTSR